MAKLTRVPAKVFAASAAADEIGQFGSAVAGSKLETADVATIQGLSAWLDGWSEALVSGNRYPALQEMNGAFKVLSYQGAYALQEGIAEYNADTTYYIGSIVKKTGTFELYGSLTNDNVGNALSSTINWQFLCDLKATNAIPLGICATAGATAEKVVTLGITALTNGLTFLVSMTNANTSATITFNVDTLGAKNVYDKRGTQITGTLFSNAANEKVLLRYNSTLDGFELIAADFWSSRMAMPSGSYINLTVGASDSTYTAPADGYFNFKAVGTSATNSCIVNLAIKSSAGTTVESAERVVTSGNYGTVFVACELPVKAGDIVIISYARVAFTYAGYSNLGLNFVYAEGSKP